MEANFLGIIYLFLLFLVLLFCILLCFIIQKNIKGNNNQVWKKHIELLLNQAIFIEEGEDQMIDVSMEHKALLRKPAFRKILINKLIMTKKNLSGLSNFNLKNLYQYLELDKDSSKKLTSSKGHIRAKGIQELAIMEQTKYAEDIFTLSNNADPLVRNEAQCGLISFDGFEGLEFLRVTNYPISKWQQIQLLDKLKNIQPENFNSLPIWLSSSNESVVMFSLKLAAFYHCYDVYDTAIKCYHNSGMNVKFTALEYLKKMAIEGTPDDIIGQYHLLDKTCKLLVLEILKDMGTEKQIPFLLNEVQDIDHDIKAAAIKTLAVIHPSQIEDLQTHSFAFQKPWKEIIIHVRNERAA